MEMISSNMDNNPFGSCLGEMRKFWRMMLQKIGNFHFHSPFFTSQARGLCPSITSSTIADISNAVRWKILDFPVAVTLFSLCACFLPWNILSLSLNLPPLLCVSHHAKFTFLLQCWIESRSYSSNVEWLVRTFCISQHDRTSKRRDI